MATKEKKKIETTAKLPAGFKPLKQNLDGFMALEKGNAIIGILRGSFEIDGRFGPKKVYRVEVTEGETQVGENGELLGKGAMVGVDEKGYLKSLSDLEVGSPVYIRYDGLSDKKSPKGNAPHLFSVGVPE